MREIKFRAWDKTINYMDDRVRVTTIENEIVAEALDGFTKWRELDDFVLMQYTGLKDKNGKEIYEGDIIRRRWLKGEEVRYVEEVIIFDIGAFWCNLKGGCCGELLGSHLTRVIPSQIEVIGNIYENPELLGIHHED